MDQRPVIAPSGELDLSNIGGFREAVETGIAEADAVIVDLSEVGFIDSSGLAVIMHANARAEREQCELSVVAPRGTAAAVLLTLSGLRRQLRVFESRSSALRG